ncbi:MAG TPA: hypothetical protein VJV79_40715, partial [Polyangiaceae bacterium]|nr:hypothetical protein [Polyangiaceae bacterium]
MYTRSSRCHRVGGRVLRFGLLLTAFCLLAEGLYLVFGFFLLPRRLKAFADAHDSTVTFGRFTSFYPGDLRIARVDLSSSSLGLVSSAGPLRARFRILPLLRGSFEIAWAHVEQVELHRVNAPAALLAHVEVTPTTDGSGDVEASIAKPLLTRPAPGERLVVNHAEIELQRADLGSFRLLGPAQFILDRVEVGASVLSANASVEFRGLRLERRGAGAGFRTQIDGKAQLGLSRARSTPGVTSRLEAELHWKSVDLGALIGAEAGLVGTDGQLHSTLRSSSIRGILAGSSVDLQCAALRVSAQASAENVQAHVRFEPRASAAAGTPVTFTMQSPRVTVLLNGVAQTFEFSGESRIRLEDIGPSGLALGMSTLRATRIENAAQQAAPEQPLSVELAIARVSWNRDVGVILQGDGNARGGNAQGLIDLAPLGPSATWLESEFSGQAFTAEW